MRTFPYKSFEQYHQYYPRIGFFTERGRAVRTARTNGTLVERDTPGELIVLIPRMAVREEEAILLIRWTKNDRGKPIANFLPMPAPEDEDAYERYCAPHLRNGWSALILDNKSKKLQSHRWDFDRPEESLRRVFEEDLEFADQSLWFPRLKNGQCRIQALPR